MTDTHPDPDWWHDPVLLALDFTPIVECDALTKGCAIAAHRANWRCILTCGCTLLFCDEVLWTAAPGLSVLNVKNTAEMSEAELNDYINELRVLRKELQEQDNHVKSQPVESITGYIEQLENIFTAENRPLRLEYLSTMGLHALNDAKEIKPNYPVGDDNEPTSTAPGGMADIECYYDDFNMICEVTMLNGRDQWYNEGQPVMRHLRDFEATNQNAYCIFIAPTIHTDSAETFWIANVHGYKGSKQKIAPITINQFISILRTLKQIRESGGRFTRDNLQSLVKNIAENAESSESSDVWVANTEGILNNWSTHLVR